MQHGNLRLLLAIKYRNSSCHLDPSLHLCPIHFFCLRLNTDQLIRVSYLVFGVRSVSQLLDTHASTSVPVPFPLSYFQPRTPITQVNQGPGEICPRRVVVIGQSGVINPSRFEKSSPSVRSTLLSFLKISTLVLRHTCNVKGLTL